LRPFKTRKRRIEAVLEQLLPATRIFWAERCAWMAATLKETAPEGDNTWSEFALVARDLSGKKRCFGADAVRHHPDAQLALVRPSIEEREHEINQVLLGLVEGTQMRTVPHTA
jgi:hypothetical protein